MYLCEKIAVKIAKNSRNTLNLDEEKEQIIKYGAITLLQTIFSIFWIIIVGLIFNVLYEALLFSIVVSILRKFSGGIHASSPSGCIIIGTTLSTICGLAIDRKLYSISLNIILCICILCILFSIIVVYKRAPVDSIKKPITNITMKKELRIKSILTIIFMTTVIIVLFTLNILHHNILYIKTIECISLGLFWQSLTLTKLLLVLYNKINIFFKKRGEKNEKHIN